jgi:hypothetical protein
MASRLAMTAAAIAMVAATLPALPVSAQPQAAPPPVFTRLDPAQAVEILQDAGYRATITHTENRQVDIQSRMSGLTVYMTLMGCTEGRQCTSIQMRLTTDLAYFGMTNERRADIEAAMVATNRWANHRRYSVSYVYFSRNSNQHIVALATDHSLFGGSTREAIAHTIRKYGDLAGEFVTFMRDPANRQMPNL